MSFVFYAVLMVVSLSSVVFGLEWLSEAPPVWKPVQVASVKQPASPADKPPVEAVAVAKPAAAVTARAHAPASEASGDAGAIDARQTSTSNTDDTTTLARAPSASDIMVSEPGSESAAAPRCDVRACTAAYRSFRASDCTWQPYDGPRRFCDRGTPPGPNTVQAAEQATNPDEAVAADQQVSNKCDIEACEQAYFTFNPADCTYQPVDGPRRLCTKGTPPRPDSAQARGTAPEPDESEATSSVGAAPQAARGPSCNVQACAAAYFTFDPTDCTYQPLNGPRRLCTK